MKIYMNEIQQPIYLDSNFVWNPEAYSLSHYKERSIFQSNVIEFWAPITDLVIPGIKKNNYWVSSWGNTWNMHTKSPVGLSIHTKDYLQSHFMVCRNGKYDQVTMKIHRIIMKTFCYFPECNEYSINHMDCNKRNNNLYNLEWCTESENTIHGLENGLRYVFGNKIVDAPVQKREISTHTINEIEKLYKAGFAPNRIMRLLDLIGSIPFSQVQEICCKLSNKE